MIKIVFCLRRLPTLSLAEFHDYWRDKHAPLVRERASVLGIRRYVQNHMFADARLQPALNARGSLVAPYDGVAELWYDSIDAIAALGAIPEARQAGRDLRRTSGVSSICPIRPSSTPMRILSFPDGGS